MSGSRPTIGRTIAVSILYVVWPCLAALSVRFPNPNALRCVTNVMADFNYRLLLQKGGPMTYGGVIGIGLTACSSDTDIIPDCVMNIFIIIIIFMKSHVIANTTNNTIQLVSKWKEKEKSEGAAGRSQMRPSKPTLRAGRVSRATSRARAAVAKQSAP
jgi:hypothetical protein